MIDVAKTIERGGYLLAVIELHNRALGIDGFDRSQLTVGDAKRAVRCPELDAVSSCDRALLLTEDLDAEQADWIVFDAPSGGGGYDEQIGLALGRHDLA